MVERDRLFEDSIYKTSIQEVQHPSIKSVPVGDHSNWIWEIQGSSETISLYNKTTGRWNDFLSLWGALFMSLTDNLR